MNSIKKIWQGLKQERSLIGNVGQWAGLFAVLIGFILLCETEGSPGSVFITAGSLIFAVGTKVKHEGQEGA